MVFDIETALPAFGDIDLISNYKKPTTTPKMPFSNERRLIAIDLSIVAQIGFSSSWPLLGAERNQIVSNTDAIKVFYQLYISIVYLRKVRSLGSQTIRTRESDSDPGNMDPNGI